MTDNEPSSSDSVSRPIIHRNLTIKPFLKQADNNDTALCWQKYKKEMECQFRFFGITDPETKKERLLIYGGQDLVDIDDALIPNSTSTESDDVYKVLIWKMDQHFILNNGILYHR